jgi:hypothetical protein
VLTNTTICRRGRDGRSAHHRASRQGAAGLIARTV